VLNLRRKNIDLGAAEDTEGCTFISPGHGNLEPTCSMNIKTILREMLTVRRRRSRYKGRKGGGEEKKRIRIATRKEQKNSPFIVKVVELEGDALPKTGISTSRDRLAVLDFTSYKELISLDYIIVF
jgi:hypothetical protein